jgi:hypothetical protein
VIKASLKKKAEDKVKGISAVRGYQVNIGLTRLWNYWQDQVSQGFPSAPFHLEWNLAACFSPNIVFATASV